MGRTCRPSARRLAGQSGNSFLEVGLVILPLFGLLFGVADVAMVLFLKSNFQNAVREGVRYAITYQTTNGLCQDASIRTIVQQQTAGFLSGNVTDLNSNANQKIKIRYYPSSGWAGGTAPAEIAYGATPPGNRQDNIVEVGVEGYQRPFWSPLYFTGSRVLTLNVYSSDKLEGVNGQFGYPCRN